MLLTGSDLDSSSMAKAALREALRECQPAQRPELLVDQVTALVAAAMGLESPQSLEPTVGFFQFGMNSLMSVTLQRSLGESLGQVLPASVVFDYSTVESLAGYLATIIPEMLDAVDEDSADDYDDLAEDELLQQLSERLS
jgi:phthiocerol/phenolphthiocerol synthesis type-I polyketide synthase B